MDLERLVRGVTARRRPVVYDGATVIRDQETIVAKTRKPKTQRTPAQNLQTQTVPTLTEGELQQATGGVGYLKIKLEDVIITSYGN